MIFKNKYFRLFASCVPVKGYGTGLIYDLERNEYIEIDNLFLEVLEDNKEKTVEELIQVYGESIYLYFEKLIDIELGFFTEFPTLFPNIDFTWHSPYRIESAIVEISGLVRYDYQNIVYQLSNLGCQNIQIRFVAEVNTELIYSVLDSLSTSRITGAEVLLSWEFIKIDYSIVFDLLAKYSKIAFVSIHSFSENPDIFFEGLTQNRIRFTSDVICDSTLEVLLPEHFIVSIQMYSEALGFNAGLNRKVAITHDGNIKNFLSHNTIFGNINSQSLSSVIDSVEFKKKWKISNDMIEKCKDCQFRYMCPSSSDVLVIDDKYYKKDLCNYDPYNNLWSLQAEY